MIKGRHWKDWFKCLNMRNAFLAFFVTFDAGTCWTIVAKMKRGQDIQLSICSYVAEKPCGCLYKLTCCNAKFHSLFKCKLYL